MASNRFYSHNGRAGMLRRAVALVVDTLIVAIVVVPLGYALQQLISDAIGDEVGEGAGWLSASSVAMLLYLGYFTLLEARGGATLGKKLLGLHVRRRLGGDISFRDSLIRNVLRVIDGFPLVFVPGVPPFYFLGATFMLTTEHGQRLGDWAADTQVFLSSHVQPAPHASARRPATPHTATPTAAPARRRRKRS